MTDTPNNEESQDWRDRVKPGLLDEYGNPWFPESLDDPGLEESEILPQD